MCDSYKLNSSSSESKTIKFPFIFLEDKKINSAEAERRRTETYLVILDFRQKRFRFRPKGIVNLKN